MWKKQNRTFLKERDVQIASIIMIVMATVRMSRIGGMNARRAVINIATIKSLIMYGIAIKSAFAHQSEVVESGDHFNNGASPKSQTSRENL